MNQDYWQKQEPDKPLFPDVLWNKPEQKSKAGKLLIVGGSAHGFRAVVNAYQTALDNGAGSAKVALPDALRQVATAGSSRQEAVSSEFIFLPTNDGGGLSLKGLPELAAATERADGVLLVGDTGMNSETAVLLDKVLFANITPVVITRDSVDLLLGDPEKLANRENTVLVMSFAQTQKLFQKVYYPKILTFSMNLVNLVENLHKFTITYLVTVVTHHQENLIVAHGGEVITQKSGNQMGILSGELATKCACYGLWTKNQPLAAVATAFGN